MPVERRYASAFAAMLRGSREYGSPVNGSTMEKFTTSVLRLRNGSMYAVVTSGISFMSDSWIAWKPRIDEPSNIMPSVKADSSNCAMGMLKCCITPGRSQHRPSANSTPSSRVKAIASSAVLNIRCSLVGWVLESDYDKARGGRFPDHVPIVSVVLRSPVVRDG